MPFLLPEMRCALTAPFHPYLLSSFPLPVPGEGQSAPDFYRRVRVGGLLSVALSVGSRPPGVTWRLALGARTFLHPPICLTNLEDSDCPANSLQSIPVHARLRTFFPKLLWRKPRRYADKSPGCGIFYVSRLTDRTVQGFPFLYTVDFMGRYLQICRMFRSLH